MHTKPYGDLRQRSWPVDIGRFRLYSVLVGAVLIALLWAGSCQAKMVTVGAALPMPLDENVISGCKSCVLMNTGAANAADDVSPVDGVVLHWHLYAAFWGTYRLRVLSRQGQEYVGAGTSASEIPFESKVVEAFPAHLSIKAGQLIGLELPTEENLLFGRSSGAEPVLLEPAIADGEVGAPASWWAREAVFPFNAEVLPTPVITGVSPVQGPPTGGNTIAITGENFADVTSVSFGSMGTNYAVDSESELTATVPPGSGSSSVPVSVVTAAGRAEASASYVYESSQTASPAPGCLVPKLKGRRLRAVRQILSRDRCRLGGVRVRRHTTAHLGRVKKQSPPPGTARPRGYKVEVTLGLTH